MANTTFSTGNANRPAPRWWRKLEEGLLTLLIPASVAIIMGYGWNDAFVAKITLLINTGLVAVIKFIGMMLANGEVYAATEKPPIVIINVDSLPTDGTAGVWYFVNGVYYYWTGSSFASGGGDRPKDPPPNP